MVRFSVRGGHFTRKWWLPGDGLEEFSLSPFSLNRINDRSLVSFYDLEVNDHFEILVEDCVQSVEERGITATHRGKLFGGSPSYLSRRSVFSKSAVIETSVMVSNLLKLQFYVLEVYLNTDIFRLACKFLAQIFSKHPVVTKYTFKNKINNSNMLYIQKGVCFLLKYYYYQTKSTKAEAATGGVP